MLSPGEEPPRRTAVPHTGLRQFLNSSRPGLKDNAWVGHCRRHFASAVMEGELSTVKVC